MRIPDQAHIAIVDGERFVLMRNGGTTAEPRLDFVGEPGLADDAESGATEHHDPKSDDYHEQDKLDHAAGVADWLNRSVLKHKIEHLIVVADPNTLGEMRRHYHPETRAVLVDELDKQFTGMPGPDILKAIEAA